MTDSKMSFKDALIAHLQGEKVDCRLKKNGRKLNFIDEFGHLSVYSVVNHDHDEIYTFHLAPRTVMCNGVEVPAPESVAPADGSDYYTPHVTKEPGYNEETWDGASFDWRVLEQGLVYLNKEDAIARAKAMLITK